MESDKKRKREEREENMLVIDAPVERLMKGKLPDKVVSGGEGGQTSQV